MLKVIADSTCNLSQETLDEYDIRIAPIPIQFGDETFEEGVDIDRDLFYKKIEETGIIPTSSQPTPAWFGRYYKELHQQGHSILVITVTGKHSGTFNSATMAKSLTPEADVHVFDSKSISLEYNLDVVTFEFAAMKFPSSGNCEYAIKLDGFDESWRNIGKD